MAPRNKEYDRFDTYDTDGGEGRPRPHKAQRLVDVMDGGDRKVPCRAESAPTPASPRRAESAPTPASPRRPKSGCPDPTKTPPVRRASAVSRNPQADRGQPPSIPVSADAYAVLSVYPEGEGETVAVLLSVPASEAERITAGKDTPTDGKPVRLKLHLLVDQCADLKPKAGEITAEQADRLIEAARLCGAIRRGMALLGYGDQSARKLAYKLTAKGIDRETAAKATVYLTEKGYIREDSTAALRAEQSARKLWGPRRIREDLRAQGFPPDTVDEAMESLSEVDWEVNCAAAIRKKYGEVPADRSERQKLIAAIMRLGYEADTVREAMRALLRT